MGNHIVDLHLSDRATRQKMAAVFGIVGNS